MPRTRQRGYLDIGIRLDINELVRGGLRSGRHRLDVTNRGSTSDGTLTVELEGPTRYLHFQFEAFDQTIELTTAPRFFGGAQWYLLCPMTGYRASVLWMPRGQKLFASQRYWQTRGKAYVSQFLAPTDRAERGIERLEAKLVYDEADDLVYKPKRMRQRTYDRICERLDGYEQARDERLVRSLFRLMRRV